jgi:hypothetical protein
MEIRKQTIQEAEGKSRGPLAAMKGMVSIPRKLNMEHLKFHLISEPSKKMERNGIKESDGAKRR